MKKITTALVVAALGAFLAVACGGQSTPAPVTPNPCDGNTVPAGDTANPCGGGDMGGSTYGGAAYGAAAYGG